MRLHEHCRAAVMALGLALIAVVSLGAHCDPIMGTRETKVKPYSGRSNARAPYHETTMLPNPFIGGCTADSCTYFVVARVMMHNPTDRSYKTFVKCEFHVGDGLMATNKRSGSLPAHSSRGMELQAALGLIPEETSSVKITCYPEYR